MRRFSPWLSVALCSLMSGCAASCPVTTPQDLASAGAFLRGLVQAPKAYVAPAAADAPADSRTQMPAARAEIAFADATGHPIPGLVHGATDTNGTYGVFKLPLGYTFVIQATLHAPDGTAVTLESLGKSSTDASNVASIDLASTLVTLLVTDGQTGLAGDIDPVTFNSAVQSVRDQLANQDPPAMQGPTAPLGFDKAAALMEIKTMVQGDAALASNIDKLKSQISTSKSTTAQVTAEAAKTSDRDPLDALTPVY
jgi:hypothetical protein